MNKSSFWQKILFLQTILLVTVIITAFTSNYSHFLAKTEEVQWEYGGEFNAHQWGLLSPEFESCKLGRNQSPVNLSSADSYQEEESAEIKFNYQPSSVRVINNQHTVMVNYEPGSSITIDNQRYELVQFHFHTPSEHTIDGEASAMEVHFVHQNDAGKLAVVGVMIDSGVENLLIARIWNVLSDPKKAHKNQNLSLNAANLLPNNKTYFSYEGSLTTPPCSEGVNWHLLSEPIEASREQIAAFEEIFQYNARPLQQLNGRLVKFQRDNTSVK